jgi:hypothetical protein
MRVLGLLSALAVFAPSAHAASNSWEPKRAAFLNTGDIPPEAAGHGDPNAPGKKNVMEKVPVVGRHFQVLPVSTAMKCVISLTVQYLLVYTALALCRTAADNWALKYENVPAVKVLVQAALTVNYAPMLAVLFLGFRMRVLQLTKGNGNPPEWAQLCMYFCTYSLFVLTFLVIIIPICTGEVIGVDPKTGDIPADAQPFKNVVCAFMFTGLKFLTMIGLYGGALAVVYGCITYSPPKGVWMDGKGFPVSPAIQCVMILSCQYFIVYGLIQFARTYTQMSDKRMTKCENALLTATNSMNFAPMLAVLFVAARMRALQMDPVNGNPQKWAQTCFFLCTYAVLVQTCLAIMIPLVLQGQAKPGQTEGDMSYTVENKMLGVFLTIGRYVIMLCIYLGFSFVIMSIYMIEHPRGPQYTPPISVTLQCVINLTAQFFFIYLMIWLSVTLKEFTGYEWALLTQTMESAKATVMFAPMLSILFVGTRIRALQLTNNEGSPPEWVQQGMYMATWSVMLQFIMCLITPVFTGTPAVVDQDGNLKSEPSSKVGFLVVQIIRWMGFVLLYGGIITVIIGVHTMTPGTCDGQEPMPVVGDAIKEPPGPNDIPGIMGFFKTFWRTK